MQEQRIQTNGIELNFVDSGGLGPVLILTHGLTANLHSFGGLMQAGLAEGVRVIRVDLRGRGLSDKPDRGYHMRDHAADILGLMDGLGLECAILVGHSFGGLLSFYLAAHHPDRVQKLVAIDAGREATHTDVLPKIRPSLARLGTVVPSFAQYLAAIRSSPYYADGFWCDELEAYYRADVEMLEDGAVRSRVKPEAIEEAVEKIIAEDWHAIISAVRHPCLLIHAPAPFGPDGNFPPVLTPEGARETVALLADGQYVTVSGHHITMLFGPNAMQVVQAIHQFVKN